MINPDMIFPLMILGGAVLFFIVAPIVAKRDQKKEFERLEKEDEERWMHADQFPPIEPDLVRAKVVNKRIDGRHSGGKASRYSVHFIVTFETETEEVLEFDVPQEIFDSIGTEQEGDLVTVNGSFFHFGNGEDVDESI